LKQKSGSFYSKRKFGSKIMRKKCFFEAKQNIGSESERFLFILKRKKYFPFVSLRSKNNLVKAKQKCESEKIELNF
jgi:hypothetical protein